MSASVACQKCDFAALQRAQDIGIGRIAEGSFLRKFPHIGQAGHVIKAAATNDANFCLRQMSPTRLERRYQTLDYTRAKHEGWLPLPPPITILAMRYVLASVIVSFLIPVAFAQTALSTATVPITLDHNRIIIDVRFPMADGSKKRVRAWVDNGDPEMEITAELAKTLGLHGDPPAKNTEALSVQPPQDIIIGGMRIHPYDVKEAKALVGRASIAPGSSAEINVPSTVLRHYDVVVDYLNRELTIAAPGTVHFEGDSGKTIVN